MRTRTKALSGIFKQSSRRVILALSLLFLILFYISGDGKAANLLSSSATVSISPSIATISGCETTQVDILVEDITDLYAADIRLSFDPNILEIVDSDLLKTGVQIDPGVFLNPDFVVYNNVDNSFGTIKLVFTQVNPSLPASGNGVLASIYIKAKSSGSSNLEFTHVELANRDGNYISAGSDDGIILTVPISGLDLSISQFNSTTAQLSWSATSGASSYQLYRDTSPYFTPTDPAYQTLSGLSYQDVGALGDPNTNYYYVVKSVCENGFLSSSSNRVGEFDFQITRDAYNAVALPLIDSSLVTADDLGYATNASTVSRWVASLQSFATRTVGMVGSNFSLTTGQGYFLYNPGNGTTVFTTVGDVPEQGSITFTITRGDSCKLNLISLPLDRNDLTTADELALDIGGVPTISRWLSSIGVFQTRSVGISGVNFPTVIGYPYWPCANNTEGGSTWLADTLTSMSRLSNKK